MESTSSQTEVDSSVSVENFIDPKAYIKSSPSFDLKEETNDQKLEDRMTLAMANLTKRLEEKFEEDKSLALKELSRQVSILFYLCSTLKNMKLIHYAS